MAYTQSDIDALKKAIGSGVRAVTFSDGSATTYRTMDEMKDALAAMQREVDAAAGVRRSRRLRVVGGKGL